MSRFRLEMKLGAEPKKVAILLALLATAAYFFYQNFSAPEAVPASPVARPLPAARGDAAGTEPAAAAVVRPAAGRREFRPSLVPPKDVDRSQIDPTLRVELLEGLEKARFEGVGRNLFEFGPVEAPRPKLPEPKIEIREPAKTAGPEPPPPPAPPVKQAPPPIPLRFYGVALPLHGNDRRVFCLQGDEILTPSEGDLIQNRYRIVRITATSVLVEDTQYKHQQQIPIDQPPPPGG